jgi:hypothetical protein
MPRPISALSFEHRSINKHQTLAKTKKKKEGRRKKKQKGAVQITQCFCQFFPAVDTKQSTRANITTTKTQQQHQQYKLNNVHRRHQRAHMKLHRDDRA